MKHGMNDVTGRGYKEWILNICINCANYLTKCLQNTADLSQPIGCLLRIAICLPILNFDLKLA